MLPLGQDVRNPNGRALIDRDLLGAYVNRCAFPDIMVWLMKDTCLPPVVRFADRHLAVAMGASLMTRRNLGRKRVNEDELKKLVFEPFANPFRVYELWKDVESFLNVFETGAVGYAFNSVGFWKIVRPGTAQDSASVFLVDPPDRSAPRTAWSGRTGTILPGAQLPKRRNPWNASLPGYADVL